MAKKIYLIIILSLLLTSCQTGQTQGKSGGSIIKTVVVKIPTIIFQNTKIPKFDHVIVIMFENRDFQEVIGNKDLPTFNQLATENVLLTQYHAVAHPSLPNYIAFIGGNTFGITTDCTFCFINQTSLPDLIEGSGRSWKTYQENLPSPCFNGNSANYAQRHDPFIYFDAIRNNPKRCDNSIVPLTALKADLAQNKLPNFSFIMPNLCNSGHNCNLTVGDQWLKQMVSTLQKSSALGQNYLIFIVFDEASADNSSCCGLPAKAGGKVAAIVISPQAKNGFQDDTPLSHYSFLKTVLISWQLPAIGFTSSPETQAITAPWK